MTSPTTLTERYVEAALRGVPERQRADVARELRSSVADAVEDRIAAGEEPITAETAVLEGLGDPSRFAAGITGRPLWLIGPDLFVEYRRLLSMLLGVVVPIVAIVLAGVHLSGGGGFAGAIAAGLVGALNVTVHTCFWVTLTFALIERVDSARGTREEIIGVDGRWTVDRLPAASAGRITAGDLIGEVLTTMLGIGGLILLGSGVPRIVDDAGASVSLLNPDLWPFTLPVLIATLVAIAGVQVIVYLGGRWTLPLAIANAVFQVGFAGMITGLALSGQLLNRDFAAEIGWPPLAEGMGPVMLSIAGGVLLVSAWEIFEAFRKARSAAAVIEPG